MPPCKLCSFRILHNPSVALMNDNIINLGVKEGLYFLIQVTGFGNYDHSMLFAILTLANYSFSKRFTEPKHE